MGEEEGVGLVRLKNDPESFEASGGKKKKGVLRDPCGKEERLFLLR